MTDHDDARGTEPHLDDEVVSAVLDGEATAEESHHADVCAACGARLMALRGASLLVRTPIPAADAGRRDAAIATAVAALPQQVVPLRRRTPPVWFAAAAAVLVMVAAVSLVVRSDDDEPGDDDVALTQDEDGAERAGAVEDLQAFSAIREPYDAGDIGAISEETLKATIDSALASEGVASDSAAGTGAAAGSASPPAASTCEAAIREDYEALGPLLYRATGAYQDHAVVVLAFDVAPDLWVFVVGVDDCAVRVQQTFPQ